MHPLVRITCIAGCALLASARGLQAQTAPTSASPEWRFGVDLLTSTIRSSTAQGAGTGSRGWGFLINGGAGAGLLSATADFGLEGVTDYQSFSEDTNVGTLSSSVTMLLGSVAGGAHTPPVSLGGAHGLKLSAGANVGYAWARASRSIARCTDCTVQHVQVKGGAFVEPVVNLHRGGTVFNARYRKLQGTADLRDSFIIGISAPLRRKTRAPVETQPRPPRPKAPPPRQRAEAAVADPGEQAAASRRVRRGSAWPRRTPGSPSRG